MSHSPLGSSENPSRPHLIASSQRQSAPSAPLAQSGQDDPSATRLFHRNHSSRLRSKLGPRWCFPRAHICRRLEPFPLPPTHPPDQLPPCLRAPCGSLHLDPLPPEASWPRLLLRQSHFSPKPARRLQEPAFG